MDTLFAVSLAFSRCLMYLFWVISVGHRYITYLAPVSMGQMITVSNLDGKDFRNTTQLRGVGNILALQLKEMLGTRIILLLRMIWKKKITTQVCLLLPYFHALRYKFGLIMSILQISMASVCCCKVDLFLHFKLRFDVSLFLFDFICFLVCLSQPLCNCMHIYSLERYDLCILCRFLLHISYGDPLASNQHQTVMNGFINASFCCSLFEWKRKIQIKECKGCHACSRGNILDKADVK